MITSIEINLFNLNFYDLNNIKKIQFVLTVKLFSEMRTVLCNRT